MSDRQRLPGKSIVILGALGAMAWVAPPAAAQCPVFITGLLGCSPYVDYVQPHSSAVAVAVADFNLDGKLDLVIAENGNGGGNIQFAVQLGNGDGTFQPANLLGSCCIDANWAVPGDFNGDGIPDIAAPSGSGAVTIWLGDGTGNFSLKQQFGVAPCCYNIRGGAVGDFNGDGVLDLVIVNSNPNPGVAQVYLGNGDGSFQSAPSAVVPVGTAGQNSPVSVVVGDFNQDGSLDFATANRGCCTDSVSVVLGNGNGAFQAAVNYASTNSQNAVNAVSLVTADFNHDGFLDVAMLLQGGNSAIAVFLNQGTGGPGTFQAPSLYGVPGPVTDPIFPTDLAVADFNNDGNPDLVLATNWSGSAAVLLGNADGTFGPPAWWVTDVDATGVATGDFNGDGFADFVVSTSTSNTVTVALGNGDGSFQSARNYVPFNVSGLGCQIANGIPNPTAVAFGDFNGDGQPDMAIADGSNCYVAIYLNNGGGTFTESANYRAGGYQPGHSIVAADVNRDGKLDLVLSTSGGSSSFSVLVGNGDGSFQPPLAYSNGTSSGSDTIAVADVNGDGKLDVISTTQSSSANASFYVSLGNGDGTFNPAVATPALCPGGGGSGAVYLALGDLNGDGIPDLAAACDGSLHQTTISVLPGHGDGTFGPPTQFASGTTPVSIAIGDFNEDGKPDLAVVDNYPTPQFSVLQGNGDGTFQSPVADSIYPGPGWGWPAGSGGYPSPSVIVTADFNLDGHLDLLVGEGNALHQIFNGVGSYNIGIQLFLGNGDGTFQPVQNYLAGRQATFFAVGDLNGDGSPDVGVVSPADQSVNILLNLVSSSPSWRKRPR